MNFQSGLDEKSLRILTTPPTTEPLFPNLRYLRGEYETKSLHLLHLPLPSLISLDVNFRDPQWFQDSLESLPDFSPDITTLSLRVGWSPVAFSQFFSVCVSRWKNLETLICPEIALDVDTLTHLSRMPALTELAFALSTTPTAFDSPLSFSNLHDLVVRSESLEPIPWLFFQIRLPVVTKLHVLVGDSPLAKELSSLFASVQTSGIGHIIRGLWLSQSTSQCDERNPGALQLDLDSLRPCMTFGDLRWIDLNIDWDVYLTDGDLLTLASAWPHLESLIINEDWGWKTESGITPDGLLKLLRTCSSLSRVAVAIDTRGYIECLGSPDHFGLASSRKFHIDVLDSVIAAESVPAVATYFANIALCSRSMTLNAWNSWVMAVAGISNWEVYMNRWQDVFGRLNDAVGRRS